MYEITEGCNIEIMGYPFYVDNVTEFQLPDDVLLKRIYG